MKFDPVTKKVTADKRKGKFSIRLNQEEKIIEWFDATTNKRELELYVFEGDATFTKVA